MPVMSTEAPYLRQPTMGEFDVLVVPELSRHRFFQLAVDPQLDPPHRKQIKLGFGPAGNGPVANPELPFPDARSDRGDAEFDALVDHQAAPSDSSCIQSELVT